MEKTPRNNPGESRLDNPRQTRMEGTIMVESRQEALAKIKQTFRQRLETRFGPNGKDPMDYHTPQHSEVVATDAVGCLEAIREIAPELVTQEDLELVESKGFAHDLVQNAVKLSNGMRGRIRGFTSKDFQELAPEIKAGAAKQGITKGNEILSAEELIQELGKYQYADGGKVFPVGNLKFVKSVLNDIGVTYAKFAFTEPPGENKKALKVWQFYLRPKSSLSGFAMATADTRGEFRIGKDPKTFRESGDAEFRELHIYIREALALDMENITPETRAKISTEIINWKQTQVGFVKWQKILFLQSLEENDIIKNREDVKNMLRRRYSNFDLNIKASQIHSDDIKTRYETLRSLEEHKTLKKSGNDEPFKSLLREIGYKI